MATYKLRRRAVADLRSIRRLIARDDPMRARTFVLELTEHFQRLADRHIQHRLLGDLGPGIRLAVHGNYNIYYRFIEAEDVLIVRELHGARDLGRVVME